MADYPAFDGLGAKDRELHGGLGLTHGKHKSSFAEFDIDVYDIAEELVKAGYKVVKSQIRMPNGPIKVVSDSTVSVALHTDVVVDITVSVYGETA